MAAVVSTWIWALLLTVALAQQDKVPGKPVSVKFHNAGGVTLNVYHGRWGTRKPLGEVRSKATSVLRTFAGHGLIVEDAENRANPTSSEVKDDSEVTCEYQDRVVKQNKETRIWCRHTGEGKTAYAGERWDSHVSNLKRECSAALQQHPEDQAYFCHGVDHSNWFYAQCRYEMSHEDFSVEHNKNLADGMKRNKQPTYDRRFTKHGFDVSSIPDDLLQELQTYWHQYRLKWSRPENHPKFDPVVSGCQTDTWMLKLPEKMIQKVKDVMKPLIAAWGNVSVDEMVFTSIYGIRMYRKGSVVYLHRDRHQTHALSAILEIGHLEFGHPDTDWNHTGQWPLELVDHNGTLVTVPNRPGQIIFYESWSCPHGRTSVYQGREVANLFIHFAPKDWLAEKNEGTQGFAALKNAVRPGGSEL